MAVSFNNRGVNCFDVNAAFQPRSFFVQFLNNSGLCSRPFSKATIRALKRGAPSQIARTVFSKEGGNILCFIYKRGLKFTSDAVLFWIRGIGERT